MNLNAVFIIRPKNRDRVTINLLLVTLVVPSAGVREGFYIMPLFQHSYKASSVGFGVQIFSLSQPLCYPVYRVIKRLK